MEIVEGVALGERGDAFKPYDGVPHSAVGTPLFAVVDLAARTIRRVLWGMLRSTWRHFFVTFATLALIAACSKSSDDVAVAGLESGCSVNSDCRSPLVCAFRTCHQECTPNEAGGSRDCPSNEECLSSDRPYYVCENPNERSCTYNSDCPSPLVCGRDLTCRDQCESASDCQVGQACVTGTCANVTELVDGGLVAPPAIDAAVQANAPCSYNTDCPAPQVCRANGFCGLECIGDRDCALGQVCIDGRCGTSSSTDKDAAMTSPIDASMMTPGDASTGVDATILDAGVDATMLTHVPDGAPDGYAAGCILNSDCTGGLVCRSSECVYECVANVDCDLTIAQCCSPLHQCVSATVCATLDAGVGVGVDAGIPFDAGKPCTNSAICQDGNFCDGVEQCLGGRCYPAASTACDDGDPCTQDSCSEAMQTCANVATGPVDADGDGFFAATCPGGNDCDDNNANVYPGHPEICDGLDNNCDGRADEGLWSNGVPVGVGGLGAYEGDLNDFTPGFARFTSGAQAGDFVVVGDNGGSNFASAVVLDSTFKVTAGATVIPGDSSGNVVWASIATNGSSFATTWGGFWNGSNSPARSAYSASTLSPITEVDFGPTAAAAPKLAWLASANEYLAAWSDNRDGAGFLTVYTAMFNQAGTVSNTHELSSTPSSVYVPISADMGRSRRVKIATNGTNVLVAFTHLTDATNPSTGPHTGRYGIYDLGLDTLQSSFVDLTAAEDKIVVGAFTESGVYILATMDDTEQNIRFHSISGTTGTAGVTMAFTNVIGNGAPVVAQLANGVGIVTEYGGAAHYGFVPLTLDKQVSFTDVGSPGAAAVAATFVGIDQKHAVVLTSSTRGSFAVQMMTCSP